MDNNLVNLSLINCTLATNCFSNNKLKTIIVENATRCLERLSAFSN